MHRYYIEHHIKTLAELWEPFEYRGYKFSGWKIDYTNGCQDGWLAQKEIVQDSIDNAWKEFMAEFISLVDKIGFISQCYTSFELQPYVIYRKDREEVFFKYAREQRPVPLHFNKPDMQSLENLERYDKNEVFTYLRESTNAGSFTTRLAMLVAALEAIAGEVKNRKMRGTDKKYIADKILKNSDLCDNIFKYGTGIRNQILHGHEINLEIHGETNYNEQIYSSIVDFFNDNYGLKINTNVVNPQRTFPGTYQTWQGWIKPKKTDAKINLEFIQDAFPESGFHEYFETCDNPENY